MKAKEIKPRLNFANREPYLDNRLLFVPTFYAKHEDFQLPAFDDVELFGKSMPVHIEFCSGNGEWIIEAAKKNPDIGWVAIEMKFSRVRKIYAKGQTLGLKNLLVVWGRGEDFTAHYLKSQSIDKVFINFPDPWPKQRHAKHRIVQKAFCRNIKKILKPQGQLHLITDDLTYRDQMIDIANIEFESLDTAFFVERFEEFHSYFYRLWKSLGRKIYSLNYKLRAQEEIVLDVSHQGVLDFEKLHQQAQSVIEEGCSIIWVFDFKVSAHEFMFFNETLFSSYRLLFENLKERLLDQFEMHTACYRLFDAALDFDKIQSFNCSYQAAFETYVLDFPDFFSKHPLMLLRHFFINTFIDFLECLAAYLPHEPSRAIHIDLQTVLKKSEFADLFSLRNFNDLDLRVERAQIVSQRLLTTSLLGVYQNALVIPTLEKIDYLEFELYIDELEAKGIEFCVIPEEHLIDSCSGLEQLFVIEKSLSELGVRALDGFRAAEGQVCFLNLTHA